MTDMSGDDDDGKDQESEIDLKAPPEIGKDLPVAGDSVGMNSDSEDEGIQLIRRGKRRMIIDDDDTSEDEACENTGVQENENDREQDEDPLATSDKVQGTPAIAENTSVNKRKINLGEVVAKVLKDDDSGEGSDQQMKSDEDQDSDDSESNLQAPVTFNRELFDAEDSSDGDCDIDRAAGTDYDSAEDKDFDESTVDSKLLKKLKKLKGAAKQPRERKSRKCKPSKDMLELHSESQRLLRESHVHLPYHKPAPKSLQDFMERARKKQEIYKEFRGARDIEKARVIQEKIAENSVVELPRLRGQSSQKIDKFSTASESRHSLPDSGLTSSISNSDSQTDGSQPCEKPNNPSSAFSTNAYPLNENELPDLNSSHSIRLYNIQSDTNGSVVHQDLCASLESQSSLMRDSQDIQSSIRTDSQAVSDGDQMMVEEFDSPLPAEDSQSQRIEDVESLSLKDCDSQSQKSECAFDSLPASQGSVGENSKEAADADENDNSPSHSESANNPTKSDSSLNDFKLKESSQIIVASEKENVSGLKSDFAGVNMHSEGTAIKSFQGARQKIVEEIVKKGVVPKLSRGNGHFVILDEPKNTNETDHRNKGVKALMDRLVQKHMKTEARKSKKVEISIIEKSGEEGQEKDLKLNTVLYCTEGELDSGLDASSHVPGSRLQVLKQKLEVDMRKHRAAAYERRQQLYRLENEEGYEDGDVIDGLPVEEEEAELTDKSDTEGEDDSDDLDDLAEEKKRKNWNNPFIDDEAEDDEEESDDDDAAPGRAVCAEINDMGEDDDDLFKDSEHLHLKLDLSDDDEEEEKEEDDDKDSVVFKKPRGRTQQLTISDDENSQEKIQPAQDISKTCGNTSAGEEQNLDASFEMMTPMTRLLQGTLPSKNPRLGLTQPVEDSQDLYGGSESDHNSSFASSAMHTSFNDDTVSQILDADGYIKIASTHPMKSLKPGIMVDESQNDGADMDELMGLCSGQFAQGTQREMAASGRFDGFFNGDSHSQDERGSVTSLFDTSSQSQGAVSRESQQDGDNMEDLLVLCSGKFPPSSSDQTASQPDKKRGVKRRLIVRDDSSDEEDGISPFLVRSDDKASKHSDENEFSGTEDENEEDHNSDDSEQQLSFKGFRDKGKLLKQFVEDEAELSGSEAESDENLDLDAEDDYLEMEEGDNDVTLSEEQLRDQVGRVHMKQMQDEDDRELMRYKEMYLQDGDLHSDGTGRLRRFHWKDQGFEGSEQDLFAAASDEEKELGEELDEKQWRMQRFEREKFLESQQEVSEEINEDNSQFLKFGKFFMKRQVSEPTVPCQQLSKSKPVRSQSLNEKCSPGKFVKPKVPKRGSFLIRSRENLAKIAEITKSSSLMVNGARNSRNFVFSINSVEKGEQDDAEKLTKPALEINATPAIRRAVPHKPPSKKQCTEPAFQLNRQNSIFRLLDK